MENHDIEKKMMSIVAEDGSIEEVEVILAFEFKDIYFDIFCCKVCYFAKICGIILVWKKVLLWAI